MLRRRKIFRAKEARSITYWALVLPACFGCSSNDDEWSTPVHNSAWIELVVDASGTTGEAFYSSSSGLGGDCSVANDLAGTCTYADCTSSGSGATYLSAGTLSITGASEPIEYTWQDSTQSYSFSSPAALLQGGETLTLHASGGGVPAHELSL